MVMQINCQISLRLLQYGIVLTNANHANANARRLLAITTIFQVLQTLLRLINRLGR